VIENSDWSKQEENRDLEHLLSRRESRAPAKRPWHDSTSRTLELAWTLLIVKIWARESLLRKLERNYFLNFLVQEYLKMSYYSAYVVSLERSRLINFNQYSTTHSVIIFYYVIHRTTLPYYIIYYIIYCITYRIVP